MQTHQPGAKLNPAMWGIFFEDINFGADGGLYAEMVKNCGFEFPDPMMGWIEIHPNLAHGELSVRNDDPFDAANPHYLRICLGRHRAFWAVQRRLSWHGREQDRGL